MNDLTYPEVGATAGRVLPPGYRHLYHRTRVGCGRSVLRSAGEAVVTWRMHRAAGVRMDTAAARAAPGVAVEVSVGIGPLRLVAPCRVVRTVAERDRVGFAYGTRRGHPERGEESFTVEMDEDGTVWFTVTAFSRPDRWYTRLAGPAVPLFQQLYAWHCSRALKRLISTARKNGPYNHEID